MTLRLGDHCGRYLADLAENDPRIVVLDGDLADSDGAIWFAQRHPDRFYMTGVAEQAMVSMAAGMASCGWRPFVFSFAAFLCYRAYDQIRVCLSQACQPVVLVGSHAGGATGRNGQSHAALNDLSLMTTLPSMTVWVPADQADTEFAIREILSGNDPAYLRLPRVILPSLIGTAAPVRWLSPPTPHVLIATGRATHWAVAVREILLSHGLNLGVLHFNRIVPMPRDVGLSTAERLFVIEDHYPTGGLATQLSLAGYSNRITAIAWPDTWTGCSGDDNEVLMANRLDPTQISQRILAELELT